MSTATLEQPAVVTGKAVRVTKKPLMRFQVMDSKHYQDETWRRADGTEFTATYEYSAHDPTCNIIESEVDLEDVYNQRGHSEKFRRLQDVEQQAALMRDDDLIRFAEAAIAKGLITKEKLAEMTGGGQPSMLQQAKVQDSPHSAAASPAKLPPHPALANLRSMPNIGLKQLAADEEIDITECKNDQQIKDVIRKALEARNK